jgi:hypothetical protein
MFALSRYPRHFKQYNSRRFAFRAALVLLPLLAAEVSACKREQETAGASAKDEVGRTLGDLEIPVALRTHDSEPTNAHKVEATTE